MKYKVELSSEAYNPNIRRIFEWICENIENGKWKKADFPGFQNSAIFLCATPG